MPFAFDGQGKLCTKLPGDDVPLENCAGTAGRARRSASVPGAVCAAPPAPSFASALASPAPRPRACESMGGEQEGTAPAAGRARGMMCLLKIARERRGGPPLPGRKEGAPPGLCAPEPGARGQDVFFCARVRPPSLRPACASRQGGFFLRPRLLRRACAALASSPPSLLPRAPRRRVGDATAVCTTGVVSSKRLLS